MNLDVASGPDFRAAIRNIFDSDGEDDANEFLFAEEDFDDGASSVSGPTESPNTARVLDDASSTSSSDSDEPPAKRSRGQFIVSVKYGMIMRIEHARDVAAAAGREFNFSGFVKSLPPEEKKYHRTSVLGWWKDRDIIKEQYKNSKGNNRAKARPLTKWSHVGKSMMDRLVYLRDDMGLVNKMMLLHHAEDIS